MTPAETPEQLRLPVPPQRTTCPRCARRDGIRIWHDLPEEEPTARTDRGHVMIDDCFVDALRPDFVCAGCDHAWVDAPLPPWWPPVPPDELAPLDHDLAYCALAERLESTASVVTALRTAGPGAARVALDAALDRVEQRYGERLIDAGLAGMVVPRDCTLLAHVLGAAVEVCRAVERYTRPALFPLEADLQALHAADDAFQRADADLRRFGRTDFAEQQEDDEDDEDWLTPEDRFAAAARTGDGSECPAVGEEWGIWLADVAAGIFRYGSSLGWARYLWAEALAPSGLTEVITELDLARAVLRLRALDVLRDEFFARLDEEGGEGSWWIDADEVVGPDPLISPFFLGVLAATEGVGSDVDIGGELDDRPPMAYAVHELVRAECHVVASAIVARLGESQVFAVTWASRFEGVRYPLCQEALDLALNHDLTPARHITFEWIGEGMGA